MSHERELTYFKTDDKTEYQCQHPGCDWTLSVEDVEKGDVSMNVLQDHAHFHRALSVKIVNSSTPVEVEIVEV